MTGGRIVVSRSSGETWRRVAGPLTRRPELSGSATVGIAGAARYPRACPRASVADPSASFNDLSRRPSLFNGRPGTVARGPCAAGGPSAGEPHPPHTTSRDDSSYRSGTTSTT